METTSRLFLTFLLNSLWQISVVAILAALVCRALRTAPAAYRHAVWVTALAAAILLPMASMRTGSSSPAPHFDASLVSVDTGAKSTSDLSVAAPPTTSPAPASRTVSFAETTAALLAAVYLLFLIFRLAGLASASWRTAALHRTAQRTTLPERLQLVWSRCQQAFGLTSTELLFSTQVSGPVTAGRTIILPESLLAERSEDVLTTAIGHEMAHIARRDFASNLLYELLLLPIAFHPAVLMIRRGIECSREMACDELVTRRLMNAGDYARSIVSIARGMTALPRPGYTLGVFDGDILEERIRQLLERPAVNLKQARLLLVTGLSALAVCAVIASSLALSARAQGAASELLKQGEAAYNRGEYQAALQQFDSAVRVEPSNVKAKLLLANTLLQMYVPGTDPSSPFATRARQQYLDVLTLDRDNKQALGGLMSLATVSKQFAEAHQWAEKAIQADPNDKGAYYTMAFVDWSMAYPDYTRARQAAGVGWQDSGYIPDAALREGIRTQHLVRVEEGIRMLQAALQIDPDYSDAMAYMNLLYRMEAGLANNVTDNVALIAKADDWVNQAMAAKRRQAQTARSQPATRGANADGPTPMFAVAPPPPPPPPPPPGSPSNLMPPGQILVAADVQNAQLLSHPGPAYPALAQQAGVSGTVQLRVVIAKDGSVRDVTVLSGHALLTAAAVEAVKQWTYRPTLLNGEPVEVLTQVSLTFGTN